MVTIHLQESVAERLTELAEARGLTVDAYLAGLTSRDHPAEAKLENPTDQEAIILAMTERLFSSGVKAEEAFDPAWPDDKYVVLNVIAAGDPESVIARECEWHAKLAEIAPTMADHYHLSIELRE